MTSRQVSGTLNIYLFCVTENLLSWIAAGIMSTLTSTLQISRVSADMKAAEGVLNSLQLYEDLGAEIWQEGNERNKVKQIEREREREKEKEREKEATGEQGGVDMWTNAIGSSSFPNEVWPAAVNRYNRLFLLASRADCWNTLGDKEKALFYIRKFVEVVEKPKIGRLMAGVGFPLSIGLRVLDSLGDYCLLGRLLLSMKRWEALLPVISSMKQIYSSKLEDHLILQHQQV